MRNLNNILHLISSHTFPLPFHLLLHKNPSPILTFILRSVSLITDSYLRLILILLFPYLPEEGFVLIGYMLYIDLIKFIFDSLELLTSHGGINGSIE